MADIEKVIRAVDTCFDSWIDKHQNMGLDLDKVRQMKKDALELLKKQEAVKPINAFKRVNGTTAYSCPRCAALIVGGSYCKHCGQAVKWE